MQVKVKCGDDVRLVAVERGADFTILKDKLRSEFSVTGDFVVKYLDEDGDMITLSKDSEWRATYEGHSTGAHKPLRLELQVRGPTQYIEPRVPGSSHVSAQRKTVSFGADRSEALQTASGSAVSPALLRQSKHLFPSDYDDVAVIDILRDIREYICTIESSFPEYSKEKNLITPRSLAGLPESPRPQANGSHSTHAAPAHHSAATAAHADLLSGMERLSLHAVSTWDEAHVGDWLVANGLGEYEPLFKTNEITGELLLDLDHETLKSMGIASAGRRMRVLRVIGALKMFVSHDGTVAPVAETSPASK